MMRKAAATSLLGAGVLALAALACPAAAPADKPATKASAAHGSAHTKSTVKPARYRAAGMPASAARYYALSYGVDQMSVKLAESGQLVRFNYRVTDAARANALHDKAASPYLLDEKVHAVLQVPVMEKVGPLRQATPAESGKSYWMAFSNKGNLVKAGHRVSVMIGQVRVDGLVVQP
jgi:hypothetical protein